MNDLNEFIFHTKYILKIIFEMKAEETEYTLDLNNFKKIPIDRYDKDFTFIVDEKRYQVPRIIADFLSPKIRQMHFYDETINEFYISTDQKGGETHFPEFLKLANFEAKTLTSFQRKIYSSYFIELGNIDEYFRLNDDIFSTISSQNAISHLKLLFNFYQKNSEEFDRYNSQIQKLILFVSSHFYEIVKEEMKQLPFEIISSIVSSPSLKIADEDSILEFIMSLYEEDRNYAPLLSNVAFCNLSDEAVDSFIDRFLIDDLNSEIWRAIFSRLSKSKQNSMSSKVKSEGRYEINGGRNEEDENYEIKEIESASDHKLEGLMHFLTKETGGNIHDNGTIEITSNSIENDRRHPKNLVDYEILSAYSSKKDTESIVCFDFKDKKIKLNSYSIRSSNNGPGSCHLRNWVVEVSNDKEKWEEVDRHSDDSALNGLGIIANFEVSKKLNGFYRFIRLRQTGPSWANANRVYFYMVDFFGKIKLPKK